MCNLINMIFVVRIFCYPFFLCNLTNMFFAVYIFRYPNLQVSYCGSEKKTGVFNKEVMEKIGHIILSVQKKLGIGILFSHMT